MKKLTLFLAITLIIICCNHSAVIAKKKEKAKLKLPEPVYQLVKYNMPAGSRELDLFGINKKTQVNSTGIISPDLSRLVYSETYYYPPLNQTTSAIYLINLDQSVDAIQRVLKAKGESKERDPLISTVINSAQLFSTLTVVDWSQDSQKLLIKEKLGENQRNLWSTNLWVYDFKTKKAEKLGNIREAITYYWKNNRGIHLKNHAWDIKPLGWDKQNSSRIIVNAYGFGYTSKQFLGCWSIDTNDGLTTLISLTKQDYPVSSDGFMLKRVN